MPYSIVSMGSSFSRRLARKALPLLAAFPAAAFAGGGGYGPLPPIGSSNVSIADPVVTRPSTTPCTVALFTDITFNDYTPRDFDYAPPPDCAGPWSKVVLTFDLSVTAGIQFDRTGTVWIGGVNVFFGTTAEPSPSLAPSWHVERDITEYSALLGSAHAGDVFIGNIVNSQYTGVISGSASLEFYPVSASDPAPATADQVLPLGSDPAGAVVDLALPADLLSKTFTLPTNIERAYLDIVTQSQRSDEFWWSCMPDDIAAITGDCPGTAFREAEISIDGTPAGVAPVYPWVYTGGLQPNLWIPIPGVQTLNFKPYRVDLTPFAGLLSDGTPHTVALGVYNVHEHFSTTATLLLYLDAGSAQVSGAISTNTLTAPAPVVTGGVDADGYGSVTVASNRGYELNGFVVTSHGTVHTTVAQTVAFQAVSGYAAQGANTDWTVAIDSNVHTTTTSATDGGSTSTSDEQLNYPFSLSLPFTSAGAIVSVDIDQGYQDVRGSSTDGASGPGSAVDNHVRTHYQQAQASRYSEQDYSYTDTAGGCYSRDVVSSANKLASVTDGAACALDDRIFADGFDGAP